MKDEHIDDAPPVEQENEAQSEGVLVEVTDVCIWTKQISDTALSDKLQNLQQGNIVVLEIEGVVGYWEKMKDGKDGRATNGFKPFDDTTNTHWQNIYTERKGEKVSVVPLSESEILKRFREAVTETEKAKDTILRAKAETENIRRRSQKEIVDARKFAIEGFARELLAVKDSLDQAAAVELDESEGEAVKQMKEGLGLTLKQLDIAMEKFSVVEVEAAPGVPFDPQCHQAISTAPSEEVEADHIVSVMQKGFLLKERLLRPAMVVVAKKA